MAGIIRSACVCITAASLMSALGVQAQPAKPTLPPLPYNVLKVLHADPQAWRAFMSQRTRLKSATTTVPIAASSKLHWLPAFSNLQLSNPILLTDGTVIAHVGCRGNWYKLTPNSKGIYAKGIWTAIAQMPANENPLYFASGVLPDGRVIVEGGEYNGSGCGDIESTAGAIYDPQADTWTSVTAPAGWSTIGDAESVVLPNGKFLLSDCCSTGLASFDPTTLGWTVLPATGKADSNNEENWTLLPNGSVLTIDAYTTGPNGGSVSCGEGSEIYTAAKGTWASAHNTGHALNGCTGTITSFEAPTQIFHPDGHVYAFSAAAAVTNLPTWISAYQTSTRTWTSTTQMPQIAGKYYDMADAPAAILPNGLVLIAASPAVWPKNPNGWYPSPTHFFTFDGTTFTQIADVADSAQLSSYEVNFLVLPSGEVLATETFLENAEILPLVCCAPPGWAPIITAISSTSLIAGTTYKIQGTQLSGLTQGAAYGDDGQADTNFPLVRITNTASSDVFYARTSGFTRSIKPNAVSSTDFVLPNDVETGAGSLQVVANGIASTPLAVTITK